VSGVLIAGACLLLVSGIACGAFVALVVIAAGSRPELESPSVQARTLSLVTGTYNRNGQDVTPGRFKVSDAIPARREPPRA
jgi:hypothetical protein